MNEFIIWDKDRKIFTTSADSIKKIVLTSHYGIWDMKNEDTPNATIHNYVGIKDTEDKSIYADCSIVEFLKDGCIVNAYFIFCEKTLSYSVMEIENNSPITGVMKHSYPYCIYYDWMDDKNIKIIDTIQENKLGLIKWE